MKLLSCSTGSLSMALKAGFWRAVSAGVAYGIGHGIKALQDLYARSSKLAGSIYRAIAHGLSRAVIRVVQGGKALGGFLSGFAGSLLGGFAKGLENVDTITKTIIVAIAGGTASVLGGGKFANGAMSAAFIFMFNEMAEYRLRQARGRRNIADEISDKAGRVRSQVNITKQDMLKGFSHAALVSGIAASSIRDPRLAFGFGAVSALSTGVVVMLNDYPADMDTIEILKNTIIDIMVPRSYGGAFTGELLKEYAH